MSTKKQRSEGAAAMGSAKSARKTAAVRENGRKGGRPRHRYSLIDAPGYHGDTIRAYSSHAMLDAAIRARGQSKTVIILEVEDRPKGTKWFRAELDALIATGSARYIR